MPGAVATIGVGAGIGVPSRTISTLTSTTGGWRPNRRRLYAHTIGEPSRPEEAKEPYFFSHEDVVQGITEVLLKGTSGAAGRQLPCRLRRLDEFSRHERRSCSQTGLEAAQ